MRVMGEDTKAISEQNWPCLKLVAKGVKLHNSGGKSQIGGGRGEARATPIMILSP
jgi:hypothetical protein